MGSHEEKEQELKQRERELQEREHMIRLRELEAEINQTPPPLHQTTKHRAPEKSKNRLSRKLVNLGKFLALVIVIVASVRIAAWLTTVVLIGGVAWVAYMLFFADSDRSR